MRPLALAAFALLAVSISAACAKRATPPMPSQGLAMPVLPSMPKAPGPDTRPPAVASCAPPTPLPSVPAGVCPRPTEAQIEVAQRQLAPLLPKRTTASGDAKWIEAPVSPTYHFGCYFPGSPWIVGESWSFYSRSEGDEHGADVWSLQAGKPPVRVMDSAAAALDQTALYGDGTEEALDDDSPTYDFDGDGLADAFLEIAPDRREWRQERTFRVYFGGGSRSVTFTRTLPYNAVVEPILVERVPAHAAFGFFPAGFGLASERSRRWAPQEVLAVDVSTGVARDAADVVQSLWNATDAERVCFRARPSSLVVEPRLRGESYKISAEYGGVLPSGFPPPVACTEPSSAEATAIRQHVIGYASALLRDRGGSFDMPIELTYGCKTHDEILFVLTQRASEGFSEVWRMSAQGQMEVLAKSYFPTEDNGYLMLQGYADVDGDGTLEAWLTRTELGGAMNGAPLTALFLRGDYRTPSTRKRPSVPVEFTRVAEAVDFLRFRSGPRDFFVGGSSETVTSAIANDAADGLQTFGVGGTPAALETAKRQVAVALRATREGLKK